MKGTRSKVSKPSRRRRIVAMAIGLIVGIIAGMVLGGGIAAADSSKATPGPSIPGAVNTNRLYEASDGAIVNAAQIWPAKRGDLCKQFVQRSAHPYGSVTIRVVDAKTGDGGVGAVIARVSLSGVDKGSYKLKIVKLSRNGATITGCPGTTGSTSFSVTSYDTVPQATPVINQRFSVGNDGTQLYQIIVSGPDGFLAVSEYMWLRLADKGKGSGH